jgi:small nuclear ribonucleoprotein (snRNP)-like protein
MRQNNPGANEDDRSFSLRELKQVQKSRITQRRLQTLRSHSGERDRTARVLLEQAERQARMDAEARVRERAQWDRASQRRRTGWAGLGGVLLIGAGAVVLFMKTYDTPVNILPVQTDTNPSTRLERVLGQMIETRLADRQHLEAQLQAFDERVNLMTATLQSIAEKARAHRSHRRTISAYTVSSNN